MTSTLSRRGLLLGGSALGAVGAFGFVSPAHAWAWKGKQSVRGRGKRVVAPADQVWDPASDEVVRALFERGEVDLVNDLLADWTHNSQPLPPGLPSDLREFLEEARQLPAWVDPAKLDTAFDFYERRGTYLGVLYGMGSGMMSCVIPREAKAVYYSAGGADMKDRIAKTAKLGYDIGHHDAFGPQGQMVVTCLKTRLTHSAVRYLLPASGHWKGSTDESLPISQADMLVTWHSLATFCMNKMDVWNVPMPDADRDAFLHLWQVTAHMLGIKDVYIPGTWDSANAQSKMLLDPVLAPSTEGKELAKVLLNLAAEYDQGLSKPMMHSFTRYCLGDQIAGWLDVPREPSDMMVKMGWPPFVAFREGTMLMPGAPKGYWAMDEMLRLMVLFFLGEGKTINITMPTGNNPHYS